MKADGDTFCDDAAARTGLLALAPLPGGLSGGVRWKICERLLEDRMAHLKRAPYSIPRPRLDRIMVGPGPQ